MSPVPIARIGVQAIQLHQTESGAMNLLYGSQPMEP